MRTDRMNSLERHALRDLADLSLMQTNTGHRAGYASSALSGWALLGSGYGLGATGSALVPVSAVYPAELLAMHIPGGLAVVPARRPSPSRSSAVPASRPASSARSTEQAVRGDTPRAAASLVAQIRSALSLNISELARVFGVERPTVYGWTKGETEPREKEKLERLHAVYGVAKQWEQFGLGELGSWRQVPMVREQSILGLLQALSSAELTSSRDLRAALVAVAEEIGGARRRARESLAAVRAAAPESATRRFGGASRSESEAVDDVIDSLDWTHLGE